MFKQLTSWQVDDFPAELEVWLYFEERIGSYPIACHSVVGELKHLTIYSQKSAVYFSPGGGDASVLRTSPR